MTGKQVLSRLKKAGCEVIRIKGSHHQVKCGDCLTTIALHGKKELPPKTLASIRRQIADCVGKDVLK